MLNLIAGRRDAAIWAGITLLGLMALGAQALSVLSKVTQSKQGPLLATIVPEYAAPAQAIPTIDSTFNREQAANSLVEALIQIESGGDSKKVGRAGERGLMQVMPNTWSEVTRDLYGAPRPFDHAFDPVLNRKVGTVYLKQMQEFLYDHQELWGSDLRTLLFACYNAGPTTVLRAGFKYEKLPRSTRDYVDRATTLHDHFLAEKAPTLRHFLMSDKARPTRDS